MDSTACTTDTETPCTDRRHYDGFDLMPIAGCWRQGRSLKRIEDVDTYRGDTVLRLVAASAEDVDEAYRTAAESQREWAAAPPQARRDVLLRAAQILADRKDEIVGWLMRETGGTHVKASTEWQLVHEGMLEAATYPFRMAGEILPCSIPGKDSRVYGRPVGAVEVISPWDLSSTHEPSDGTSARRGQRRYPQTRIPDAHYRRSPPHENR